MSHRTALLRLTLAAFCLCLGVVVLGAYVRLSSAGLGCPDWPGCYGHLTPALAAADAHTASAPLAGRPLELGKAWREMLHRYAATTLGMLIVALTVLSVAWRRDRILPTWFALALLAIVILQGTLGALTVTWQLKPLIVTLHLLFGFTTLSLLWWALLSVTAAPVTRPQPRGQGQGPLRQARLWALAALVGAGMQIALGGWTSSNYAAIACPDLPTCQGSWWPSADFQSAYTLWRGADIDYEGGVLENAARVAIHLTHRVGALVLSALLAVALLTAWRLRARLAVRLACGGLLLAWCLQLLIGVGMVRLGFPLWLATAHNAGAALLLLAVLALNRCLWPRGVVGAQPA
jgi:cytochrome c oxidase assembly protein subunit 15